MSSLFWRQFRILFWKNWIVLSKHPLLNILRCFVLPVAYGIFLAVAQVFLVKRNNNGLGTPAPVYDLHDQFDEKLALIWVDATNQSGSPTPSDIMARVTQKFTPLQKNAVRQVRSPSDIPAICPQNFNLFSECFAGIVFQDIPSVGNADFTRPVNYTIRADGGLFLIDVNHNSDFEKRILPLQWAIDKAIIELQTGVQVQTPLEWPYTIQTNEEQDTEIRLGYIRGLRTLLVLALCIAFVGIAYQLPGAVTAERATLITAHMKAMGLLDSAKILSWHLSITLAYLPAWTIVSLVWHYRIFTESNAGFIFIVHILFGLLLASYSFFVAAPFGKSPQLAAVASTLLSIVLAILALVFKTASTGAAFIFSIIFPPGWYVFVIRAICGWENNREASNLLKGDPDSGLMLLPLIIAAVIDIFLWPWLGSLLENRLYDARNPKASKERARWFSSSRLRRVEGGDGPVMSPDNAISIQNLEKTFKTSLFRSNKGLVTAVADLTLQIPKYGIFVLLGSNGAGKSTTLSILAGLIGRTRGTVQFENGNDPPTDTPKRGTMGIVPQKNVLFPELTCYQTLRVWRSIKWSKNSDEKEDLEQLLRDCDLGAKIHSNANNLSGGQKRKLQLAIGLVGGSEIVLVDECTSGVDPLSRRALWRTLTSFRHERTIVFTTHFLDEADLLADHIAILAAPGKLVAEGTPVALKRDLGGGYNIQVMFGTPSDATAVLQTIKQSHAPETQLSVVSPRQALYHLRSKDSVVVERVLSLLEERKQELGIASYDVLGTTIEDIFLDLMQKNETPANRRSSTQSSVSLAVESPPQLEKFDVPLALSSGKKTSPLRQAFTIFYKRWLIARRSWLTPALAVLVAIAGCSIPLVFVRKLPPTCVRTFRPSTSLDLYLPVSGLDPFISFAPTTPLDRPLISPPGLTSTLGNSTRFFRVTELTDNSTFIDTVTNNYRNVSLGGISVDLDTGNALVAWEGTSPGYKGPVMLNLASNILYNRALNTSGRAGDAPAIIRPLYSPFPPVAAGTLSSLRWVAFFGAAMSVYPAFFAVYVSKERVSAVQAMQFSNGLTNTAGLWLGHLMFDSIFAVISATIIIIVFATASNQFHGPGFFWLVMLLYGIAGTLFAYCLSLIVSSPLAAFAAVAGYQIVMFVLYIAAYLLTLTYAKTSEAGRIMTILHFTLSVLSPVASVTRASLVSVNLFSLLCIGDVLDPNAMGDLMRYGGPILYLIVYCFVLFGLLVWYNSGSILPSKFSAKRRMKPEGEETMDHEDVLSEEKAVSTSDDLLRVLDVSKTFDGNKVVDDVSLGVARGAIFALLGPNGAGKTTTFNMIRGDIIPDQGDVFITGTSVRRHPKTARSGLGVCPQFTAIDSQLTVREHLIIYGRLKGLESGDILSNNVNTILQATALMPYADRLASKLSGGNQRKLSLAIALIGNPSVVLIDEFSTGIDARMKREMWMTLRNVAIGKAVIITTHSMEEASALATKVGILAKRMLAVGTIDSLSTRYGNYEVHFSCRTREDLSKAQVLMSKVPGARLADDVATRFEVPISSETGGTSLAQLFHLLSTSDHLSEHTVERASLESIFLKVIRENQVSEEDTRTRRRRWWKF
ncbi:P-loop containing nucleoside triphosphate hydrolase protein [Marasmius fiardii PR-910]|nr:P-loop containing nucleoside triphosphate hydrolase protein [Marasmius fiardii PR-910]